MAFSQSRTEHNLERMNALIGCRSVDECVTVQTELARDNLAEFLQSARRMSEISAQAIAEAVRRISQASLVPKTPDRNGGATLA